MKRYTRVQAQDHIFDLLCRAAEVESYRYGDCPDDHDDGATDDPTVFGSEIASTLISYTYFKGPDGQEYRVKVEMVRNTKGATR